ncbi:MAG: protein phosphatase 2C domain-containing protein [Planctomycetes bacterium]|nr:protein phosphatase 2C domain-containing protein [Planctomycetota bacterium]
MSATRSVGRPGFRRGAQDSSPWRVVAASVCGSGHEKAQAPCQDAHAWRVFREQGVLVAAVADGAGAAELAALGAAAASQAALEAVCRGLSALLPPDESAWEDLLRGATTEALEAVRREAGARGVPQSALATTLALLVATPHLAAAAQVGDGAVVAAARDGNAVALTTPDIGEYLNETTFLISPNALDRMQFRLLPEPVQHVAVFTDGLEMLALKMPEAAPHGPFFAPLFRFVGQSQDPEAARAELEAFLRCPRVRQRTDDDVTLLLAARVG